MVTRGIKWARVGEHTARGCCFWGLAAGALVASGCGTGDDDDKTVVLKDTGTVTVLAETGFKVPTTVAVRSGTTAWVPQGQLNHYVGMDTMTPPDPFTVASVPVAGGGVGTAAISLPGNDVYPEGIAAAPDGTLYVGSMQTGRVYKVPAGSTTAAQFVAEGVLKRGNLGLEVDPQRSLLWACDSDPGQMMPGGDIVGIKLSDGTETVRHAMSPTSLCNDLIVDPSGNLWATDSFGGNIYRIAATDALTANSAKVWLNDPKLTPPAGGFGANGIALVSGRLFVSVTASSAIAADAKGMLVSVDPTSMTPASSLTVVNLTEGSAAVHLSGPDGIEALSATELLIVENGFIPPNKARLVKATFDIE